MINVQFMANKNLIVRVILYNTESINYCRNFKKLILREIHFANAIEFSYNVEQLKFFVINVTIALSKVLEKRER